MRSSEVEWNSALRVVRMSGVFDSERQGMSSSGRISYVQFDLGLFRLEVYHDKLTDEVGRLWRDVGNGLAITDPIEAIFYFASDIEPLVSVGEGVSDYIEALAAVVSVYSSNRWVFFSREWVANASFNRAFGLVNEWASRQRRPMVLWEFERRMFMLGKV